MSKQNDRLHNALKIANLLQDRLPDALGYHRNATAVEALQKIARAIHRLDEQSCNGYQDYAGNWDEAATIKADKRAEKLQAKAETILKKYELFAYWQSDPRGWPLYILTPEIKAKESGYYNQGVGVCPF